MWLACPECRDESAFEQPPCEEGHGLDCPEWFCVTCGFAVFAGGWDINGHAINEHAVQESAVRTASKTAGKKPTQRHHAA